MKNKSVAFFALGVSTATIIFIIGIGYHNNIDNKKTVTQKKQNAIEVIIRVNPDIFSASGHAFNICRGDEDIERRYTNGSWCESYTVEYEKVEDAIKARHALLKAMATFPHVGNTYKEYQLPAK